MINLRKEISVLLLAFASTAFSSDIGGKWEGSMSPGGGPVVFVLKADLDSLTGTALLGKDGHAKEIRDGKIHDNSISFSVPMDWQGMSISLLVNGTVSGNEMHLRIDAENGYWGTDAVVRKQAPPSDAAQLTFEVASIKRSPQGSQPTMDVAPGGRLTVTSTTLKRLIMFAYAVSPLEIAGGERWTETENYDVVAKPPEGTVKGVVGRQSQMSGPDGRGGNWSASWTQLDPMSESTARLRQMVQSLLAERFQLKLHKETKELPVYELVRAKNGLRLQESKSDAAQTRFGPGQLKFEGAPVSLLATMLSQLTGHFVLDRTGLNGNYDFTLEWAPDSRGMQRPSDDGSGSPPESSGPSIFNAIQEQLGLKLNAAKGNVPALVIDHATKPSEN